MMNKEYFRIGLVRSVVGVVVASLIIWQWPNLASKTQATHAGTHMLMMWDGASPPSGWSVVTTYDGRYIRGDTVANVLTTGGVATHTPTQSGTSATISAQRTRSCGLLASCTARSTSAHTHTVTVSGVGSANNLPAYRNLALIRYDNGIPPVVPAGAIGVFSAVPSGWTRYSAQDGKMVRLDSTNIGGTGGSDTHSHDVTWPAASSAGSGSNTTTTGTANVLSVTAHTHTVTGPATFSAIDAGSVLPPYVEPLLAEANSDTNIPTGMYGMFDADPGAGWLLASGGGNTFGAQLMRPNTGGTFNGTSQGATTHSHIATSNTSGGGGQTSGAGTGTGMAAANHTHVFTIDFNAASSLPEYVNVVFSQRLGFTQVDYRWYVDSDAQDVIDPWDNPNIAQNTAIAIVPQVTNPPELGDELRLRVNFRPTSQNLLNNTMAYRLQYKFSTDGSCTTGDGWIDVGAAGSGSEWRYASSTPAQNTRLTVSRLSPVSNVLGNYIKANPTGNNPAQVNTNNTIEWDFHIQHNGRGGTQFSFRMADASGAAFGTYTNCPTLSTYPVAEKNFLRHGKFFRSENREGYFWAD